MSFSKEKRRQRIHWRIRSKIKGTAERPRLSVFRSNREIYCQAIDDVQGHTLFSASSREDGVPKDGKPVERAKKVGELIAERAKEHNIENVVFDRSGYLYHGRVKSLAEGAREGGLKF
ncbi:MAG: 50S ribosomal protein L18 [Phaeodactylibacter sp.]|nr:50S ribosomal protein L18 [Phaeodactylibacter sp.]MCB9266829.1 50S ribosomal protein L18 [Lewinellaceae bacterium]MCB9287887.1 50S ribosomal protein L18 [Lewinellaceae bacterium]